MSNIDPPASWADVDGINTNERLLGGPSGPLNRAVTALTARSKQLRDELDVLHSPQGAAALGFQFSAEGATLDTAERFFVAEVDVLSYFPPAARAAVQAGTFTDDCLEYFNKAALSASIRYPSVVVIPDGRYRLSGVWELPAGVSVRGTNRDKSYLYWTGATMDTGIFVKNATGTDVRDLRLYGTGVGGQPANTANAPTSIGAGSGIVFANVADGRITNCRVENFGGTTGVAPNNGVAGIWLTYGCTNTIVDKCVVTSCRNGINEDNYFQKDPHGNKILHNVVDLCRFGVALDSGPDAYDSLVQGNSISRCQQSGIDLNKARYATIAFNNVRQCGLENGNSGIFLYGTGSIPSFHVKIFGNECIANGGHGIKAGPQVYYAKIHDNDCDNNSRHGLMLQGLNRYWSVCGNNARANTFSGFYIFRPSDDVNAVVTTGILANNVALQNQQSGFLLDAVSEATISGNIAKDNSQEAANTYDGFRLTNAVTSCTFQGNISSGGNQRYAVAGTDSGTTGNTFNGNTFVAGASGRLGFANLTQNWGDNGDGYATASGAPTGTYPNGARVYNNGDQRLYVRGSAGWRYVATTATP